MENNGFVIKKSLGKKYLLSLVMSTVFLAVCISIVVSVLFQRRIMERYEYVGFSVSDYVASMMDGDEISMYLSSRQADDEYEAMREFLYNTREKFGLIYLYIAVPGEDHLTYLWEATSGSEMLGFEDQYSPGGEEWSLKMLANQGDRQLRTFIDPQYGILATAASPIYDSSGKAVALAYADFSIMDMAKGIISMIIGTIVFIFGIMALFTAIFYMNAKKSIVDPIRNLTVAASDLTNRIDKGDDPYVNIIHTGDEIEALSRAFESMDGQLRGYIAENSRIVAEKERIGAELSLATDIQADSLPSIFPPFPDRHEFDLYATMDPAKEVGGDFYDFFMIDEDHLGLVIADVSGKGVPAALFMMVSMVLVHSNAMSGDAPNNVVSRVNDHICENNANSMFVTIWFGVLEISTGRVHATNAGHEYPVIRHANGEFEYIRDTHGLVVGAMDGIPYEEYEFTMEPGSTLFVYTDGVPEATSEDQELFGEERLLAALNKEPDADMKELLSNVRESIDDFVKDAPQFDDITMLGLKYKG